MIGLQFQRLPNAVGDEGVIAVSGEEGELGTGCGFTRRTMSRAGGASGLVWTGCKSSPDIGGAVHPVGNGSPVLLWYRLDQVPQASALADGDREADIHFPAGGNDSVGVEAAVGPHRELSPGPTVAPPARAPSHAGSGRRHGRCWPGPRAAGTRAPRRCHRQWPAAGDSQRAPV